MLTVSVDRALLINRITIDKLSEDVLLEIFDAFRQVYELEPFYETVWNGTDGWFKLTHVCQSWRRLVHLSPSRLHMHLLFTPRRSSRVKMLKNLPPFPILVDYSISDWTERELSLAIAAIRHRSRVRGITIHRKLDMNIAKILRAMKHPFPELENLEIASRGFSGHGHVLLILPATFLSGFTPCLRRLMLQDVLPRCLSPLLSSAATGLVELILSLRVSHNALPEASLIANLQRMSCLRRLELSLKHLYDPAISDSPGSPTGAGDIVPLPNLMEFEFHGHKDYIEALVVVLAAPHLQHLDAEVFGTIGPFSIPHLCKFICMTDKQFTFVRLHFSPGFTTFTGGTRSESDHAQSFRIFLPESISLEELCNRLSGPLTTVEELVVGSGWDLLPQTLLIDWRQIFDHIKKV
ncbi:hypothetical protein EI94DRAFT_1762284, partial [Lactarius quietus]